MCRSFEWVIRVVVREERRVREFASATGQEKRRQDVRPSARKDDDGRGLWLVRWRRQCAAEQRQWWARRQQWRRESDGPGAGHQNDPDPVEAVLLGRETKPTRTLHQSGRGEWKWSEEMNWLGQRVECKWWIWNASERKVKGKEPRVVTLRGLPIVLYLDEWMDERVSSMVECGGIFAKWNDWNLWNYWPLAEWTIQITSKLHTNWGKGEREKRMSNF